MNDFSTHFLLHFETRDSTALTTVRAKSVKIVEGPFAGIEVEPPEEERREYKTTLYRTPHYKLVKVEIVPA